MKIFGYILIFAFLTMSIPLYANACSVEDGVQNASMNGGNSHSSKSPCADCLCVAHHMQFNNINRAATVLDFKVLSIKFNLPQDVIFPSFEASVLLQPPSIA